MAPIVLVCTRSFGTAPGRSKRIDFRAPLHFSVMSAVVGGRVRFEYPTLRKEREGWGTRRLVAGIEPKGGWYSPNGRPQRVFAGANYANPLFGFSNSCSNKVLRLSLSV